jgi:hypothetical protein
LIGAENHCAFAFDDLVLAASLAHAPVHGLCAIASSDGFVGQSEVDLGSAVAAL